MWQLMAVRGRESPFSSELWPLRGDPGSRDEPTPMHILPALSGLNNKETHETERKKLGLGEWLGGEIGGEGMHGE